MSKNSNFLAETLKRRKIIHTKRMKTVKFNTNTKNTRRNKEKLIKTNKN